MFDAEDGVFEGRGGMRIYLISIFLVFCSCTSRQNNSEDNSVTNDIKNSKQADSPKSYEALFIQLKGAKNADQYIPSETWREYESMGNPDTALTLFCYRVCRQPNAEFDEVESYINLYLESHNVSVLLPQIFSNDTSIKAVQSELIRLNHRFREYAVRQVEEEIKEFGMSDGPLFEFVQKMRSR